ncbi:MULTISPECIES: ammonium transporter [unclassified Thermotoga]|uniref:ammonium transporter n=1 Tax=unclassified Thermotoga TaxID=2631113 RepID=UPI000280E804|nr:MULTISPECIES: ammonium transporter [unclassified Thermotoga]AIY86092.1 ammonium transporter [Thermotoga sp. 2812B]EJX27000.1 ammonium transporter [Thermotoga sp. EMP]
MRKRVFSLLLVLAFLSVGFAQDGVTDVGWSLDMVWILISAALVFFMQAGFAMVESGFTRAKNTVNVLMKNLMDFAIGSVVFFIFGYWIMFGKHPLTFDPSTKEGLWDFAMWMFQMAFAGTAATIVSGAMAERTKFPAYLAYTGFITGIIYSVVGRWIWGGGWLAQKGFIDFAGSTVVHSVGGWAAMIGASLLGPRFGKYDSQGNPKPIPGHNIPLAALGTFILWFGWFGFNGGSTLAGTNGAIGMIILNTNLAAATGALAAMVTVWAKYGKPDASMTMNGALAGLVAITAPCAVVSPVSSLIIGAIGGVLVVFAVEFFDKVLKIDDPVGAISVHGVNGAWGTLAVGLFAESKYALASGMGDVNGLFFGGGVHQLGVQFLGVISVFAWTVVTSFLVFWFIKKTIGLRVDRDIELKGLDIEEHGMEGYADFEIFTTR